VCSSALRSGSLLFARPWQKSHPPPPRSRRFNRRCMLASLDHYISGSRSVLRPHFSAGEKNKKKSNECTSSSQTDFRRARVRNSLYDANKSRHRSRIIFAGSSRIHQHGHEHGSPAPKFSTICRRWNAYRCPPPNWGPRPPTNLVVRAARATRSEYPT